MGKFWGLGNKPVPEIRLPSSRNTEVLKGSVLAGCNISSPATKPRSRGIKVMFGARLCGASSTERMHQLFVRAGSSRVHILKSDCFHLFPVFFVFLQLFRRVAAALPGMESTQDKSREDSILYLPSTGGESLGQLTDIPKKKEGQRGKEPPSFE